MMHSSKNLYWHFAASCCLVLFVILGYIVKFYENTALYIDEPLLHLVRQGLTASKTNFFITITNFGSSRGITILVVGMLIILAFKKYWLDALWLLVNSALIAGAGNYLIKFAFSRPRPSVEHLVTETHYSFPSGHAMGSLLFYGTIILLLPRLVEHNALRLSLQIALGVFIFLIGLSRVYLGVHYPTDILGGFLLGAAWLLGTYPTFEKQRFIWRFKGKQS